MITTLNTVVTIVCLIAFYCLIVKFFVLCSQINDIHDRLFAGTEQDEKRWKPEPYEKDSQ